MQIFCLFFDFFGLNQPKIKSELRDYFSKHDVILTADFDGKMSGRAVSDNPDDSAVGLEQPCVLFVEVIQFKVIEEVAHESCPVHAERLKSVAKPPMA